MNPLNIHFKIDSKKLEESLKRLTEKLNFQFSKEGIVLSVKHSDRLFISCKNGCGEIGYTTEVSFFRMLSLFLKEYAKKDSFYYEEKQNFDTCGPMLDLSRNAAVKVEKIKEYIDYTAMMGLNTMVLYLEDMYELSDYPYFGYMRGRYSKEELKAIDDYAFEYGIEVYPAIQTLGHLERYLHWDEAMPMRDTMKCLFVGEESTYRLIDSMLQNLCECFRSRKIHVGMDEAFDFGLGAYLKKHGYQERNKIFLEHLSRVVQLAEKYSYQVFIWSDMFFRLASQTDSYEGDLKGQEDIKTFIPQNTTLVYWNYYTEKQEEYDKMLSVHKELSNRVAFAGGILNWFGFTCDTKYTFEVADTALKSCKENEIRNIYATVWADNGGESDIFFSLCGLQLYAEHMYNTEGIVEKAKENFEFITKGSFEAWMLMSDFHNIFEGKNYEFWYLRYMGKRLFYQDILLGCCDYELSEEKMSQHYRKCLAQMQTYHSESPLMEERYHYVCQLFQFVSLKCEVAEQLYSAYQKGALKILFTISETSLKELYLLAEALRETHLKLWYDTNKPHGGEVLDIRYSGILGRIKTARNRISAYVKGEINCLEELEESRLPFTSFNALKYAHIVTQGML